MAPYKEAREPHKASLRIERTFFLPLLADMAAMALASLDFCSLGACEVAMGRTRRSAPTRVGPRSSSPQPVPVPYHLDCVCLTKRRRQAHPIGK